MWKLDLTQVKSGKELIHELELELVQPRVLADLARKAERGEDGASQRWYEVMRSVLETVRFIARFRR